MTATAYRSEIVFTEAGFAQLVRSEWTKFRTVRGWVIGLLLAALLTVLLGFTVLGGPTPCGAATDCVLVGPSGEAVVDHFTLAAQELPGDGSITVRVSSLTGQIPDFDAPAGEDQAAARTRPGLVPWAKAGVIIKESETQGSPYAAVMVTGEHGVRMQDNFTNDVAGSEVSATDPHWLRLTRSGDTVTGYESTDGMTWAQVGTAQLTGNPSTVLAGMFVASPDYEITTQRIGGASTMGNLSEATATFDNVTLEGGAPGGEWTALGIDGEDTGGAGQSGGADDNGPDRNVAAAPAVQQFTESDGTFTMTGSGDIAPAVAGPGGNTIERGLIGVFAGLVAILVVSTSFVTAEFRRHLIRTTFIASPRRGRVLAAKAVVLGTVTFIVGLVSALIAVVVITQLRRSAGGIVLPVSVLTEVRVVVGTAALLALSAVFALAVGTILRRSAAALTVTILLTVLPYLLAVASVLPAGPTQWLLRITPAAGFAITQSTPEWAQVDVDYLPRTGFFPLAPWAGFAVLCVWTALALGLANVALQRRDA